jgi:hypothetical protein
MIMHPVKSIQRGFAIITIVLTAAVLLGVLGTVLALSRGSADSSVTAASYGSAIISQGQNLVLAFHRMEDHLIPATDISYGNAATGITDLQNLAVVSLSPQTPPAQAFSTGTAGAWILKSTASSDAITTTAGTGTIVVDGIGTAAADYAFVLGGLSKAVCQEINRQASGNTVIPVSGAGGNSATWTTPATAVTAVMTTVAGITGVMQGCVATTDATVQYVYYVVAEPQ